MTDIDIERVKQLIAKREEIDTELSQMFKGVRDRKPQRCSKCGSTDHNARACRQESSNVE